MTKKVEDRLLLKNKLLPRWFRYLENILSESTSDWFVENKMTIADIAMWRLLGWLISGIIDGIPTTIVDYPKLKNIHTNVHHHPKVQEWMLKTWQRNLIDDCSLVNKFALIRNARGADLPNLYDISKKCIEFGADGITVHPRPDERHAKFSDLEILKNLTKEFENIEFNIEGYPSNDFIQKVIKVMPDQVTLVPDPPDALTSSFGWDCKKTKIFKRGYKEI